MAQSDYRNISNRYTKINEKLFTYLGRKRGKKITERIIQQLSYSQNSHFFSSVKGQLNLFIK